jgi:hypothetical protein
MNTFIRVVEVWTPDASGSLLEFGGGIYPGTGRFGAASRSMCFGRGEGLPGRAWEQGRPIVLKQFEGSYFRRTRLAAAEGLTCGIAVPVFAGDVLKAVLLMFCGDDAEHAGAIELWHHAADASDMTLDDGYYGSTAEVFEFISRQSEFRKGTGLPGLAWESGLPVFMPDLGKGTRFLRSDSALKVGINRGLAVPCSTPGPDVWVMAFLSALATPIARRFEIWTPDSTGRHLRRLEGHCERDGVLGASGAGERIERGEGALGRALLSGAPTIADAATDEPGAVGAAARAAGLQALATLPVLQGERVLAVVAWYL